VRIRYYRGFSFITFWCEIGKYDVTLLLFTLVFSFLFAIFLVIDNCSKAENYNIENKRKYYTKIIVYNIFSTIFKTCTVLLFLLFIYSIIVTFVCPNTCFIRNETEEYPGFFKGYNYAPLEAAKWRENRIYSIIFCAINLLLIIFVGIISSTENLVNKMLSLKVSQDKYNVVKWETKIKVNDTYYDVEVFQNSNIYLQDMRKKNKYYEFIRVIFKNKDYFLKITN
jgi:hypothetical protein